MGAKVKPAVVSESVEGPWALPEDWRWALLGSVASSTGGGRLKLNKSHYADEGYPAFSAAGQDGLVSQWEFESDAVVLSSIGARCGKSFYATGRWTSLANTQCIFPSEELDVRYLWHFSNDEERWERSGSAQPFIKPATIKALKVPLPPLDIQRRIVSRIDELFSEIDDGEAALERARDDLATWRKALLKAAVTGELTADWRAANPPAETGADLLARILTERRTRWLADPRNKGKQYIEPANTDERLSSLPEGWALATLAQLGDFGRGKSKHRPRNDARLYGGDYPFVQTGNVAASRGRIKSFNQTYSSFGLAQSKLWPSGTLCITIAANIAKTGVLDFDACFPDSVVGLSPAEGIDPYFIELVIRTLQQALENEAPATAQKNINLETLEGLTVPLPPSAEQAAIVAAFGEIEACEDLVRRTEIDTNAATLRQSILAAAFRGDLVA